MDIPYAAKFSCGKTFAVFVDFQPIVKVFPLNHLLCTVHDGHGLMHRESFPMNSVFCAQLRKFSHLKVLPHTVIISQRNFIQFANSYAVFICYYIRAGRQVKDIRKKELILLVNQ